MKRNGWLGLCVLGLNLIVLASGCSKSGLNCTRKNAAGMPEKCIEVSDFNKATELNARAGITVLCEALGADIKSGLCDTDNAFFGCVKDASAWTSGEWYYPTPDHPNASDYSCTNGGIRVGQDREPIGGDPDLQMSTSADLAAPRDFSSVD